MALGSYASSQLNVLGERSSSPSMFDFQPKQPTEDKNISSDEAKQLFTGKPPQERKMIYEKLKSNGYSFEDEAKQSTQQVTTQPAPQEIGMASSVGQFGKNLSAGIASGASQAVGGTLGILGDFLSAPFSKDVSIGGIFTGKNTGGLGQLARDETARQQASGAQAFGANTESMGYKGGKFGTGLGLSIATPGGVLGMAGKGAGLATRAGLGAVQGGIETGKFLGLTEGRLGTPGELAIGATVGGALPVLGAGLGKAKDVLMKTPEQKMMSKLGTETVDAIIDNVAVKVPKPKPGVVKSVVSAVTRADDPKVLAGRALTPSYAGKTPKQIMGTVANVEKNVNEFWKLVRTGKMKGDLTDLTTSAQSVVDNIDDVGAKIGGMVKSAKGQVGSLSDDTNNLIGDALGSVTAQRSPATQILQNLVDDLGKGIDIKDGFALKRVYQNEIGKLIRSGDAGTDQFSALVKGVDELSNQIDTLVEKSAGSKQFLELKQQYSLLKKLASDITKSAQVEARRSPMTLTEQMGTLRGVFDAVRDPLGTANQVFAKTIGEMNTRGGAWQKLIETYDGQAIKKAGKIVQPQTPSKNTFVNSRSINPFKDLSFIKKLGSGEVKGLSPEATNIMKGVKTPKEAMARAKQKDIANEVTKVYRTRMSADDIDALEASVAKKDFPTTKKSATVKPIAPKTDKMSVSNVEDDLIKEARKYGSAEEFVKSLENTPNIYFHGTNKKFDKFSNDFIGSGEGSSMVGQGVNITKGKWDAENYAYKIANRKGGEENIIVTKIKPNLKVYDFDKLEFGEYGKNKEITDLIDYIVNNQKDFKGLTAKDIVQEVENKGGDGWNMDLQKIYGFNKEISNYIKSKGYDGVKTMKMSSDPFGKNKPVENLTIFNPDNIKIIDPTDIYNKSKIAPKTEKMAVSVEDDLIKEARKYGSAEEFVKGLEKKGEIMYHGTNQEFKTFDTEIFKTKGGQGESSSIGHFFTDSKQEALEYAQSANRRLMTNQKQFDIKSQELIDKMSLAEKKGNWTLAEDLGEQLYKLEQDAKKPGKDIIMKAVYPDNLFKHKIQDNINLMQEQIRVAKIAKKQGFKGVIFEGVSDSPLGSVRKSNQTVIFDAKDIKTESQLTDIYNKSKTK